MEVIDWIEFQLCSLEGRGKGRGLQRQLWTEKEMDSIQSREFHSCVNGHYKTWKEGKNGVRYSWGLTENAR